MVKKDSKPDILFISGSPRSRTCVALIDLLEQGAKKAGAKTQRFLLSKKHINPCVGCGGCSSTGNCVQTGKAINGHFADDYLELKAVIERVDALAIVSPLYFAGPPSQLKALYDRMQPYWALQYLLGRPMPEKRPAQLFVVGGGADPHGYMPLAGTTKSALAVAGFNLEKVNNFVGFRSPKDMPAYPASEELARYSHAELARLKRRIAQQDSYVQRAVDAGGAFARFVVKKRQANDLAEQLAKVEAELEDLKKVGDVVKSEQVSPESAFAVMDLGIETTKGKLQAGIDLDYSNLRSQKSLDNPAETMFDELADEDMALDPFPEEGDQEDDTPADTPDDTPTDTPDDTPADTPEEALEGAPERAPKEEIDDTLEEAE
ncbi:MAG: flavodoxin family protein [Coriobacteriia bacterium]|nr:flavodoxin family protein [Coriobacteriia bacterium]